MILRWLPPASTGNCTISGYTVEYREEGVHPAPLFLCLQGGPSGTEPEPPYLWKALPHGVFQLNTEASGPGPGAFYLQA